MITINGQTFHGNNVSIIGGVVKIDGVVQNLKTQPKVEVVVTGDVANLQTDGAVTVNGNVTGPVIAKGSVNAGNVEGNVQAGGSVNCGNIGANVSAGGSVNCSVINGRIL